MNAIRIIYKKFQLEFQYIFIALFDDSNVVKKDLKRRVEQLNNLIKEFCEEYLNSEYEILSLKIIEKLSRKRPSPLKRGKLEIWAGSIVYALGQINFLFDKSNEPYIDRKKLTDHFKVKKSTISSKAKQIRDTLDLYHFDPKFSISRIAATNPLRNFVKTDEGIIMPLQFENKEMELTKLLIEELPKYLPIKAQIHPEIAKTLKVEKREIRKNEIFEIKHILYVGPEGGIVCDITPPQEKNPHLISLTHLVFDKNVAMYKYIHQYQQERITNITN